IPSKTLLHSAKIYDYARFSEKYGVKAENVSFDHKAVIKRKNKVVKTLIAGIKSQLKASKVELIEGVGTIEGRGDEGYLIRVGDQIYTGKRLLIATGSVPA